MFPKIEVGMSASSSASAAAGQGDFNITDGTTLGSLIRSGGSGSSVLLIGLAIVAAVVLVIFVRKS